MHPMTTADGISVVPRAAASIAVVRGDRVLLIERGKAPLAGRWSFPGGRIEPGETARAAALRELDEETGVAADVLCLIDVHDAIARADDGRLTAHYLIAVFAGRWMAGEPLARDDARAARFVTREEACHLPLTAGAADLIERAFALALSAPQSG
jgi:8-oxo-dGTP diphosphatase